jgi:hypothetical protein
VASGHGETRKRYQVQIDGSDAKCHDEIVSVKSKKQGTSASARQPKDAVPGDKTIRLQLKLINDLNFSLIDIWDGSINCHGLAEGT